MIRKNIFGLVLLPWVPNSPTGVTTAPGNARWRWAGMGIPDDCSKLKNPG